MSSNVTFIDEAKLLGLPKATEEKPFAQVEWIFQLRQSQVRSSSGQENYNYALGYYLRHLQEAERKRPYILQERWDSFALIRFRVWLDALRNKEGKRPIGAHVRIGLVSCVRQAMTEAVYLGLTVSQDIINVSMPVAGRETDKHSIYSKQDLAAILEVVKSDLRYTNAVIAGYKPTSVGRDPRLRPAKELGLTLATFSKYGYGWTIEDNLRWYFENVLNCVAISTSHTGADAHMGFFRGAIRYHGGFTALYRKWGVTVHIDREVIWPLVIQLGYLTGLNPESLATLKLDCLIEHPLTGTPVLRYLKLRSTGEKELLIALLNNKELSDDDYEPVEIPLKREHAILVQRTIDRIVRLTKSLRENRSCSPEIKDLLWVYQSSGNNCFGEIQTVTVWKLNQWCRKIAEINDLRTADGSRLEFTLVRFRPTRLTEMAAQGKDLFEIQHVAGHKSILTTLSYIEKHTLDDVANREVSGALMRIWQNRDEYKVFESERPIVVAPLIPYKGLISDCKNVFDPPHFVKQAADYVEGQSCTRFNMCLLCKNVVAMKEHLPYLALYRTQIRVATAKVGVDLPNMAFYAKSLAILDQIFDPDTSEFEETDLDEAVAASELLDMVLDPLVYSGGVL
jgi:integrase